MPLQVAPFGSSFEVILPATGALVMTSDQANTNMIRCDSGMPETITLPPISALVAAQNLEFYLVNKSTSGGTATIAAPSGNSIVGATTAAVATGRTIRHDGLSTFYII